MFYLVYVTNGEREKSLLLATCARLSIPNVGAFPIPTTGRQVPEVPAMLAVGRFEIFGVGGGGKVRGGTFSWLETE